MKTAGAVVLTILAMAQGVGAEERASVVRSVVVERGEVQQGDVVAYFGNVVVRGTEA